jgi:hypothetical protein
MLKVLLIGFPTQPPYGRGGEEKFLHFVVFKAYDAARKSIFEAI